MSRIRFPRRLRLAGVRVPVVICPECGNEEVVLGEALCLDCLVADHEREAPPP